MPFHLRPATIDDLDRIIAIEIAAGELFRTIGMDLIADDAPPSRSALLAQVRSEELIVAESRGTVAGYLLMGRADGTGHLHQLSVDPGFGRQGAGTALVAAAAAWAERRGLNALTLTTFTEVPWNGPWYRRLGFVEVPPAELGPQLRAIQIAEQAHGLTAAGGRAVLRRPTVGRGTQRAPASKSRSADPSAPTSPASTTVRAMPDSAALAHDLRLATTRLVRRLRQEQPVTELTLSQMSALAVVAQEGPLTAGDLAAREQVRPPSITRVVDSLVTLGLVQRRDNPDDGRQVLVEVTEEGRGRIAEFIRVREEWLTDRLGTLSDAERVTIARATDILDRITER